MIKGTKSGTTLRSILSRMIDPTERAAKVMEELGIQFYNTDGTMKSLSEIITIVNEKTSGLTEQQRNQALSTIFGQQALTGMLALMEAGPGKIDELTESYKNCDGAAKEMADTINDNTKGSWIEFKSALEGAAIAIGDVLLPHLRKGIEWLTDMVSAFANLDPAIQENIVKWGLVVAAIGPVLTIGGKFIGIVGSMMSALSGLGGVFATLAGPVGWITLAGTAIMGLVGSWELMQTKLDNSTKSFKQAEENLESFEGKVRTADYWLAETFGEDIKIEFSAEFETVKKESKDFYDSLLVDLKDYYAKKYEVDHDGCEDVEEHEKHKQEIQDKYNKLQEKLQKENEMLNNRDEEISQNVMNYLTEEGYDGEVAGKMLNEMQPWIDEKIKIVQEGNEEILRIEQESYDKYGELTKENEEEINKIRKRLEKERAIITSNNVKDIMEAWEQEIISEKVVLAESEKNHEKYQKNVSKSVLDGVETYGKGVQDRIDQLKEWERTYGVSYAEEIAMLEKKKEAIGNFGQVFSQRTIDFVNDNMTQSQASRAAFREICKDLESGKINTEEFGMTQEEYLGMALESMILAGAGADDLAYAIMGIPEEKRADVIAKVEGKTDVDALKRAMDSIRDKTVTMKYLQRNVTTYEVVGNKAFHKGGLVSERAATGKDFALPGLTEVAEYGSEIIATRNSAMLATGRQLVNLAGGEKIYNARQTKDILDNMGKSSQIDYSHSLRIINSNIILLKEAIERKNLSNVVNNVALNQFGLGFTKEIIPIHLVVVMVGMVGHISEN